MKRTEKNPRPMPRDSKRTHRAKSQTLARKQARAAKRAQQGR